MWRFVIAALAAVTAALVAGQAYAAGPSGRYRDWRLDCVDEKQSGGGTAQVCLIQHEVKRRAGDGATLIARVRFVAKQPMLLFLLPPSLSPKAEVSYTVDKGATAKTIVKDCSKQICWAVVPIGEYLLASLKAGRKLSVGSPGVHGTIDVPLTGFTAAYNRLQQLQR